MNILYIYRHPKMGFSIGRVFQPIEEEMRSLADKVDSVYLPVPNYSFIGLWKNISAARKAIKEGNYDVVHITGAEHYLIPFIKGLGAKVVVTVHDLGSIKSPGVTGIRLWLKEQLFIDTLKKADVVTFISQCSQDEANSLVGIDKAKEFVVPDAIEKGFVYTPKIVDSLKPRILHLGTKWNKNLNRVIEALRGLNCHLRIIGKIDEETHNQLKTCGIEFSCDKNLSDEQIIEEYKQADVISFPSLYEGFGMPIIEGQAIGRIVVTSNREPMASVANGAAIIVDPEDVTSIRSGFLQAFTDASSIISLGLENAKHYFPAEIAKRYFEIYKNILP